MTEQLLPYYNRELAFFRRLAADFAHSHPKIAGRLRLGPDTSEDPHVERLIEAFALINARTRFKLDDDFPEITDALLGILYPHYLAPLPSMAIVQFLLDPAQGALVEGYDVPRGANVETDPIHGEPCRFRSCYPVKLWPIRVETATLTSGPIAAPKTRRSGEAAAVLKLKLRCLSDEVTFAKLPLGSLRFFLKGLGQHTFPLYEMLLNDVLEVALAGEPGDPQAVVLHKSCLQPVGFEREDGMVPYPARSSLGYRLLTEYFAFPEKFLFVDLQKLDPSHLQHVGRDLEVYIYLRRTSLDLEQNISKETFRLGCTPVVNLFKQRAEPVQLAPTQWDYRVVPDARRPLATEVFSVDQAIATRPDGKELRLQPFYSISHASDRTSGQAFYHTSRRPAEHDEGEPDHGTEVFVSMVNLQHDSTAEEGWYLDLETTCLNRDLPNRLPFGGDDPRLHLSAGAGPIKRVLCLTPPTATRRPPSRHGAMWRLISHLSLGHLSITGEEDGALALKEILRLYDPHENEETRNMIDGISSITSQRVTGRVQAGGHHGVCRGVQVTIQFDEDHFTDRRIFLFASVLEHFLGLQATINSFSQLVATVKGRSTPLCKWPPRAGERVLL